VKTLLRWTAEIALRVLLFLGAAVVAWFLIKVIYIGWSQQP
jgi:hypothetical protein